MKYLYILFLLLFSFSAIGNNIRVEGKTRVVEFLGNDTAVVEVTLLWDNSWRDDFNWDAAWIFFKYKKRGELNGWHPVLLSSSGHGVTSLPGNEGGGYTFMVGAGGGRVMGLYVLREGISEGNVKVSLRVKWPLSGSGVTKSDFGEDYKGVYVAVHAIEMVYIPYGAYSLGDGFSGKSFVDVEKEPLTIDSEDARSVYTLSSPSTPLSLSSSYPKGYAGFYVMKYEVSQEQYVEFLNSLTLSQQKDRVGNNDFEHMEKGDYVFGDLKRPNCRNGIAFISQPRKEGPAVFGNNLNRENDFFSVDDGQTLACNYLSIEDMLSYCSWSGLRPMSELEYEKACRRFYPQVPEKGEYAWNTSSGVNSLQSESELSYRWSENEQAVSKQRNVNSGGHVNGPVRCGLFATSSTSQSEAGATYWGVMEMGGNVKELCVNVNYTSFDGSSVGFGEYNPGLWNVSFNNYGVRGGGFSSRDAQLRTSDRTEAEGYFSSSSYRDSTVGFRGVYGLSGIRIDGGEIKAPSTGCRSGISVDNSILASCPDFPDALFQYTWYVKKPGEANYQLIPGITGKSITYSGLINNTTSEVVYSFKRVATCMVGTKESNAASVKVPGNPFSSASYNFNAGSSVTVSHSWGNAAKSFSLKNAPSWAYIHGATSSSVTIAGGLSNADFVLECVPETCPQDVFTTRIIINNTFVYKGVADSVTLAAGRYKMECWGARGGGGGFGGYVKGEIDLTQPRRMYVYVGQMGGLGGGVGAAGGRGAPATFNGGGAGGNGYTRTGYGAGGCAGGGASDIRLEGGLWNNFSSLKSRLIIASGGGGTASHTTGGAAGGLTGYNSNTYGGTIVYGATQTSGNTLGQGGTGASKYASDGWGAEGNGGGGGGYYGGYASKNTGLYSDGSGAGGSSFISGHNGCNAISASSSAGNVVHTGQPKHYSGLYFTNTVLVDGAGYQWTTGRGAYTGMPNLGGTGTMTGNTTHGQVRITPLP